MAKTPRKNQLKGKFVGSEARAISTPSVFAISLTDDGTFPNSRLPLLVYPEVLTLPPRNPETDWARLFNENRWDGHWVNGIYSYQHYHSTAHEVLGVFSGWASVQFGGPSGVTRTVRAGDMVILPAGVAHCNLGATDDFGVVGAYPAGQRWDMCYGTPGERPRADKNIACVPVPKSDPMYGEEGPLLKYWSGSGRI